MEKKGYVYILASRKGGVLYTGVTSNIEQRILQHKRGIFGGFTKKYCIHRLVRFQEFSTIMDAIEYEKVIKGWKRIKKIELIEKGIKSEKICQKNRDGNIPKILRQSLRMTNGHHSEGNEESYALNKFSPKIFCRKLLRMTK